MSIDWKLFMIVVLSSIIFSLGMSTMIMFAHTTATSEMEADIIALQKKMDCPNNECDRFKGKDALVLEARLMAEIEKVKKDCKS